MSVSCGMLLVSKCHFLSVEINAKYMETSAKTGHNIGEYCSLAWGTAQWLHLTETMFMTIAEDFVSRNKTASPGQCALTCLAVMW